MAATVALRTVPVLSEQLRVLAFHAGRPAQRPSGPDVIARLADEAVAVLDADGAPRAHVYGLSFGGLGAPGGAPGPPHRVAALVLPAPSAGGGLRIEPDDAAREFIRRRAAMPLE